MIRLFLEPRSGKPSNSCLGPTSDIVPKTRKRRYDEAVAMTREREDGRIGHREDETPMRPEATGSLDEWLALVRSEQGLGPLVPTTVIAPEPDGLCNLCDDYGPRVAYHQPGGQVLRLHAACQAIWLEERDRPR